MKIPKTNVEDFARELIKECYHSRETRIAEGQLWERVYWTGSDGGRSKDNLCYSHVDKLSSYLFSPADVRFDVSFAADEAPMWKGASELTARHVTREFRRTKCNLTFAQGVDMALVKGCSLVKLTWGGKGYAPFLIRPEQFGVIREDLENLDEQDAFVFSYWLTPSQLTRMMHGTPQAKQIIAEVLERSVSNDSSEMSDDYFHQIVAGGTVPIGVQTPSGQSASASVMRLPKPTLAPEVATRLIKIDELWVVNDEGREGQGDYATIRMAGDKIIAGQYRNQNLCDIPGEHPFVKVCPNEVPGYFWGRSELATVLENQLLLNDRMDDVDYIFRRQAKPARMITGMSGISDEKARILNAPSGILTDSSPTGKIDTLAPTMPPIAMEYIGLLKKNFEEAGGFTPMTSGQGDPNIRSGAQGAQMMKTSTPRLRDRALIVEEQCAAFGDLCLRMSQEKDARVFSVQKSGLLNQIMGRVNEFMLSQLPDDTAVSVHSHTSSPAFSGESTQLAFALAARGAIDGEDLIKMVHPPREDELIVAYRQRQEAQQKFMAEHPELALQQAKGKKK